MRRTGKITTWNDAKGFGFIEPDTGGTRIFIHMKAFGKRARRPVSGDSVTFAVDKDNHGRTRAVKARLTGGKLARRNGPKRSASAILFGVLFLGVVGISVIATGLSPLVLIAYIVISFITFVAYALDKSAAQRGSWRTKENTLHLLALAGGWPGGLIAQQILRHKSKKASFRIVFWATVLLNLGAFTWFHTADGRVRLGQLLTAVAGMDFH